MNNVIGISISSIYIFVVLVLSKFLNKKGEEVSRKFVHISLCNIWFIFMFFIDSVLWASILPALFVVINSLSYKFKIIKSMEREENDGFGTVYYAASLLIIALFTFGINKPILGLSGILMMGYGDGLAAIVGQKIKSKEYNVFGTKKSLAGSTTMFMISLFVAILIFKILNVEYFVVKSVLVAIIATVLEAFSVKGLDNITVPVVITFLTYFLL